jgi:hypothetical protein
MKVKFTDLKVGTEYAVIPAWDYSSAEKKDPNKVERRNVAKAELISLDKFEYIVFRSDSPTDPNFKPAPKGSRSVGYLVKSMDWANQNNGQAVYFLSRPQDIVAPHADLETRWVREEAEQERKEQEMRQRRIEEEQREREVKAREERLLNSCMEALQSIIGSERIKAVKADLSSRRTDNGYVPHASFTFDARTLQYLIEKVLEAKDLVG